jgi:GntR family transcriptional regulator of arabinose operon
METKSHKYEIILEFIKEQILNKEITQGDKILSENELALKFNLSRFTVRHAINILTNEGWLDKHHGSGTYVKIGHTGKRLSHVIGVITTYLDDYIFPSIINGIDEILTPNGYTMTLGITGNKTEKELVCLNAMLQNNVDGLIIEGTKSAFPNVNIDVLSEFKHKNIPVVFINGIYSNIDFSYVLMDDEKGGYMAASYLIDNGHTMIGGIFKSDDIQGHKRYKGFINACRCRGLIVDENSVLWYTTEDFENIFSQEYDKLFMKRFSSSSAIICYNDQIAVKVIDKLERNGKSVPEDISIISFDNSNLAEVSSVKLTSITHAGRIMGQEAATALLSIMSTSNPIKKILDLELIERNSVKKLK